MLRAAICARVSCWLVTSHGIVDLLAPLCCLAKPSCAGCFFGTPDIAGIEKVPRIHSARRWIFVSSPVTALEACSLIQKAKDRMDDIEQTLGDTATM